MKIVKNSHGISGPSRTGLTKARTNTATPIFSRNARAGQPSARGDAWLPLSRPAPATLTEPPNQPQWQRSRVPEFWGQQKRRRQSEAPYERLHGVVSRPETENGPGEPENA